MLTFLPLVLIAVLILGAGLSYLPLPDNRVRQMGMVTMILSSVVAAAIAIPGFKEASVYGPGSVWYVDGIAAMVMLLIAVIYASALVMTSEYLVKEKNDGVVSVSDIRHYYAMVPLFIVSMYVAVMSNNVGLLWIAIEATTLSTTLLVAFYRKRSAIEAAWKYVVLCSLGITIGLVGVLLTTYATGENGVNSSLLLSTFREIAAGGGANTELMRWAFVFLFIGIGTKVGFVPMHAWLPDAHSKTPAPISGLLSGILLNVSFVALLRFKQVTDTALNDGSVWTNTFFLVFGAMSIILPSLVMLIQKNYKRLMAYSSVEHMGLMAFAVGVGPAGIIPALMHMPGHALIKSSLFFGAGKIFSTYKTNDSITINDVWLRLPKTAGFFLLSLLGLLGVPPSALFVSELLTLGFGLRDHLVLTLIVLVSLTLVFVAMMRHLYGLLFGARTAFDQITPKPEPWSRIHVVMGIHLILTLALGIFYLTPKGLELMVKMAQTLTPGLL